MKAQPTLATSIPIKFEERREAGWHVLTNSYTKCSILPESFVMPGLQLVPEKKRRQFPEATTPRLKFVCCTF
jgi:hypothetical protein